MDALAEKLRLSDVSFADIESCSTTRADGLKLLAHLVKIARPNEGAPTFLIALAHLATCVWLRGALRARFRKSEAGLELEIVEDLGKGQRVPFYRAIVNVQLEELAAALPHLKLRPLRLVRQAEDAIVLGVALRGKRASLEPPPPSEPPPQMVIPKAAGTPSAEKKDEEIDESW